jgi:DNA-binding CsgD family transcriptional regulator
VPTTELLERKTALETLNQLMLEGAAGHGRLVFLGGEAGVGKTALLETFCESRRDTVRVFTGACDPLATPRPLGPLMDMAPSLGEEFAALLAGEGQGRVVFATFLTEIATRSQPSLVAFEDVHWADDSTFDLLRFLGRRVGNGKTLIVATYRDDEVGPRHRLRTVMGDLATSSAVRRLSLHPLSESAVAILAEGSHIDPVALHRQTGGNPFFVTEILAAVGAGIPATVRDAVLARAARLSPAARSLLEAASVIGLRADSQILSAVCGDSANAVEECLSIGVLRPETDALSFRHELARATIIESIHPARLADLHRRVLEALLRDPAEQPDLASAAHHAEAAGDAAAVLQYAPLAARQASSLRAHREAASQYARALRFARGLPLETRAAYLEGRSYQCYLTNQLPEALAARQEAVELWRELGDQVKLGENLRWLSRAFWFLGRNAEAEAAGREAVEVLATLAPGPQLAWAFSNQAQLRMLSLDVEGAIEWGRRAIELARRFGDPEILAHAANNVGTARLVAGDDGGRQELEESLRVARDAGLEEHAGRAYVNLVSTDAYFWRLEEVERYAPEGLAYCADHDLDTFGSYLQSFNAFRQLCRGRWEEATQTALSVVGRPSSGPLDKIVALCVLGRARARRGDPGVLEALDEALRLAESTGELQRLGPVRAARAEAAWLAGDLERAAAEAEAAIDLAEERKHRGFWGELAYWRWRSGRDQRPPEGGPEPFRLEMLGQWAEAAEEWSRLGCPYEAAYALTEGDDPDALLRAFLEFERLGAVPAAAEAAKRLRALGVKGLPRGPRASTSAHPASLTEREAEVLHLLAEGLRNAEIASRLYLSPKTVSHHVSAILAKLGVRTRTEAARAASGLEQEMRNQ